MAKRGLKSVAGAILAVMVVVPVIAALAVWTWRDQLAEWVVVNHIIPETGFTATFDGPFEVTLTDTLNVAAGDIRFAAQTNSEAVETIEIGQFVVAFDMGRLLRGAPLLRRLTVRDATLVLNEDREPAPVQAPSGFRLPFIESAELVNIRILHPDEDPDEAPLHDIRVVTLREVTQGGQILIDGDVIWNGSDHVIKGTLGGPAAALDPGEPFPIDLVVQAPEFTLDLDGTITDVLGGSGLSLQFAVAAPDVSRLSHYVDQDVPAVGPLKLAGRLTGGLADPKLSDLSVIVGGTERFLIKASGTVDDLTGLAGADIPISVWIADPALFAPYLPEGKPSPDSVEIDARLVSTGDRVTLKDIAATIRLPEGVSLTGTGSVGAAELAGFAAPDQIELAVAMASPTTAAANTLLDLEINEIGAVALSGRFTGAADRLSFRDLDVRIGEKPGPVLLISGDVEDIDFDNPLGTNPLQIVLTAEEVADLSGLFDADIPALGPGEFRFTAIGIVEENELVADRWEDLTARIGTPETALITATGRIANWNTDRTPSIIGMELEVDVEAQDFSALKTLFDLGLPDRGQAKGKLRIAGNSNALAIAVRPFQVDLPGGLVLDVSGDIGRYDSSTGSYQDVAFTLDATAPDTGAALAGLGIDLPIKGPLTAKVVGASEGESLSLSRTAVEIGPSDRPTLALDGAVTNADDPAKLRADGAFRLNMSLLANDLVADGGPDLGLASGRFTVSGAERGYAIDHLGLSFDRIGALTIEATGAIDPNEESTPLALDITARADSVAQLAADPAETVLPDSSLFVEGRLAAGRDRFTYSGAIDVGKSTFGSDILVDLNQPTELTARIRGQEVRLVDLGLERDETQTAAETTGPAQDLAVTSPLLFGAVPIPIERLGDLDMALTIETGPVEGRNFSLTRLFGQYDLLDGRLRAKTEAQYEKGKLQLDGSIDSRADPPTVAVTAVGDDLRVDNVLAQFGWPKFLEGDLHLNIDIASHGRSPRDIAAALGGTATIAVDKGRIQIGDLERISSNRFQAKAANVRRSGWTELACGVVRLRVEEGVAKTDGLVLATPNVVIGGSGQIDLRDETLDIVLAADRQFTTAAGFDKPVRVHGPLTDPEVSANISGHVGDAALTGGEVAGMVALPFIFVPIRVASFLRPQLSENDNGSACLLDGAEEDGDGAIPGKARPTN